MTPLHRHTTRPGKDGGPPGRYARNTKNRKRAWPFPGWVAYPFRLSLGGPLVITRDLELAKKWVRERVEHNVADGFRPTSGAFASSKNGRLRAYGLEVG